MNRPSRTLRRAGFTLVELIAVFVIIGLLAAAVVPNVMSAIRASEETACAQNLDKVRTGFLEYQNKYKRWPKDSGVGFFAAIVSDKVWMPTVANTRRLNCPAVDLESLDPAIEEIDRAEWYAPANKELFGPGWSSYSGRDLKRARLRGRQGSGKTALMADDNDDPMGEGGNHFTTTNVLWDDLQVRALELVEEQEKGLLSDDESVTYIPVGADSPIPGLQSLTNDR